MKNVEMEVKKDKMILTVDLGKDFGASSSGKTITVASSSGNVDVPGHAGVRMSINVYKYPPREKGK